MASIGIRFCISTQYVSQTNYSFVGWRNYVRYKTYRGSPSSCLLYRLILVMMVTSIFLWPALRVYPDQDQVLLW